MLVLTRKFQEKICIGDDIVITVVRIAGNSVRLGIEAPTGVRILRDEIRGPATEESPAAQAAPASQPAPASPSAGADQPPQANVVAQGALPMASLLASLAARRMSRFPLTRRPK